MWNVDFLGGLDLKVICDSSVLQKDMHIVLWQKTWVEYLPGGLYVCALTFFQRDRCYA